MKNKYWFMEIKDKVETDKTLKDDKQERYCPPHYLPHKFPMGEKVITEPCHFHESFIRTVHHNLFCQLLKCPNYKDMLKAKREYFENEN